MVFWTCWFSLFCSSYPTTPNEGKWSLLLQLQNPTKNVPVSRNDYFFTKIEIVKSADVVSDDCLVAARRSMITTWLKMWTPSLKILSIHLFFFLVEGYDHSKVILVVTGSCWSSYLTKGSRIMLKMKFREVPQVYTVGACGHIMIGWEAPIDL